MPQAARSTSVNRNAPCPCGSGKRYKHCHGSVAQDAAQLSSRIRGAQNVEIGQQAPRGGLQAETLAAHRAGELGRAEALYRRLIAERPDDLEARQMLAGVLFERLRYGEALVPLWDAAERDSWRNPVYRTNLGFALAKLLSPQANARQQDLVAKYVERERSRKEEPPVRGRVSVVLVAGGNATRIERSIDSVVAQTHRDLELVIASYALPEAVASKLNEHVADLPFSVTVVDCTGASRSVTASATAAAQAAHAANVGARRARGDYLAFLEAGDWFAHDRIETMIAEIARASPLWGFSRAEYGRAVEQDDRGGRNGARETRRRVGQVSGTWESPVDQFASFALRRDFIPGITGNLFVQRDLFLALGGYRDVDRHGWDFCLRAGRRVEPVFVERPLYFADSANRPGPHTPSEAEWRPALERRRKEIIDEALADDPSVTNEFCPQFAGNRLLLLQAELHAGRGDRIPIPVLRAVAAEWRDRVAGQGQRAAVQCDAARGKASTDKVALVVLGVYRSGTSALARVLNLCGAALPENVIAARLDINRKGFWETEAVVDLNARMLQRVGAGWNGIDVTLPPDGPIIDEFLETARQILESEYNDKPLILIKDPRMCVFAPIWHRALRESGYRPAYVVAVRDPREVAGSLARSLGQHGGMPHDQALALWHSYTKATETFVNRTDAKVVFVHYDDLLDDWRSVVRTIAKQLDVVLDVEVHADAIDRFLDPSLRSQRAERADGSTSIVALEDAAMEGLYRRILDRCARATAD
jgi:hypothetical protein